MAKSYVRCRKNFVTTGPDGRGTKVVHKGDVFAHDDKIVKRCPDNFDSVEDLVEEATANPGEQRRLRNLHRAVNRQLGRQGDLADEQLAEANERHDGPDEQEHQGQDARADGDHPDGVDKSPDKDQVEGSAPVQKPREKPEPPVPPQKPQGQARGAGGVKNPSAPKH